MWTDVKIVLRKVVHIHQCFRVELSSRCNLRVQFLNVTQFRWGESFFSPFFFFLEKKNLGFLRFTSKRNSRNRQEGGATHTNGVIKKHLAEETRPIVRNIRWFQGFVGFFFFYFNFSCSSSVLVCDVHAFPGLRYVTCARKKQNETKKNRGWLGAPLWFFFLFFSL